MGMSEQIRREIRLLKTLIHPNITRLFDVIETPEDYYLVMELAQGGDLFDFISKQGQVKEDEARKVFYQLVAGLNFAHCKGVAHRDLKPENLLFDRDHNLKIADFGLCNSMQDGVSMKSPVGSTEYAAPEIV